MIPALETKCVEFLKTNLEPENAFMLLGQARIFDEPQLASLCLHCIDQNTKEAFEAESKIFLIVIVHNIIAIENKT